jgi:hypothetical protein
MICDIFCIVFDFRLAKIDAFYVDIPEEDFKYEFLYTELARIGFYYPLDVAIDIPLFEQEVRSYIAAWRPYNARKSHIRRWGLSLTSLDGGMSGVPDLDSLVEYNELHGTCHGDDSFKTPTAALLNMKSLQGPLEGFIPYLGRSHLLRFGEGGYFPFHRDSHPLGARTYRLIALLSNCDKEQFCFLFHNRRVFLEPGKLYAMNTKVDHALFSFVEDATILVCNLILSEKSVLQAKANVLKIDRNPSGN